MPCVQNSGRQFSTSSATQNSSNPSQLSLTLPSQSDMEPVSVTVPSPRSAIRSRLFAPPSWCYPFKHRRVLSAPYFDGEWLRRPNRKESLYVTSFRYQTGEGRSQPQPLRPLFICRPLGQDRDGDDRESGCGIIGFGYAPYRRALRVPVRPERGCDRRGCVQVQVW